MRPALGVEQDVRGLDVAVDHAVAVGVVEGVGHRGDELGRLAERKRPIALAQDARQRRPLDEFLDQVERPVARPGRSRGARRCRGA